MALDTITIKCLTEELANAITGARIEKVYQPEKDEIILNIKSQNGAYRLVISANASQPRIHFTDMQKENPQKAPMFCMLLRKHIQGGKIASVLQIEYERIIRIDIDSYDELGDLTRKYLYCEIMGRHSNIILTKENHIVIDSIKHIDFSLSSVRQILPGLTYITPPAQNKTPVLSKYVPSSAFDFSDVGLRSDKIIMNTISGISPLAAREAVFCVCSTIPLCGELSRKQKDKVITEVLNISDREIKPCIICEKSSGKIIDFSPFDIFQYGDTVKKTYYQTVNEMLDEFYKGRDLNERMKQKSSDLVHLLRTNIERISKKIAILQKTLKDASKRDEYKLFGDLITANIYKIKQGDASVSVVNYYDASGKEITIDLNKTLSPSANAQRYYKLYQKAKTAEIEAAKQLEQALSDLDYLESTLVLTQNSQTERDLNEIRSELSQQGYIKIKAGAKKQKKSDISKPHHYISSDGFDIYVGKNNMQNDYLSLRFANSGDIWFHTKKIHGSHTIIKLGTNKDIPPSTIKEAAMLAAYYSKGRDSSNVPVDYTQIKNVRKPNGAKPGMVIYDYYNTIYVTPEIPEIEKID